MSTQIFDQLARERKMFFIKLPRRLGQVQRVRLMSEDETLVTYPLYPEFLQRYVVIGYKSPFKGTER